MKSHHHHHHHHHHSNHDHHHNSINISKVWKTLSGQNNWEGLLDPLDLSLRKYIIHYGEMAQSTYDAINDSEYSKNAGNSRFSKTNFFAKVGLETVRHPYRYRVTKFLYATAGIDVPGAFIIKPVTREAWSKESNFIGFVAVAEDETVRLMGRRDIVVVWRGTVLSIEWVNNLNFIQVSGSDVIGRGSDGSEPKIHQGWYSIYTSDDPKSKFNKFSARNQVIPEIQRLVELYKNEEISITTTGHSLGAALATLSALDIVVNNIHKPKNCPNNKGQSSCLVTSITFASPRIGNSTFKSIFNKHNKTLKLLKIRNLLDLVPNYPPLLGYADVGEQLTIDTTKSQYLKKPGTVLNWHNMEGYLHGVSGTQGSRGGFELVVDRDIALANKSIDNLKEECLVPGNWWIWKNKGMVLQLDGSWVLKDYDSDMEEDA